MNRRTEIEAEAIRSDGSGRLESSTNLLVRLIKSNF
ncbi:hypothetical protein J2T10_002776 [Paenarthrobacter nicotinovorans]|uniref:Uncharacterized protein n=1 Tax=Paenarthrobacter nicotinovorans TaxID=29320 RepID=A0ABT9TN70_PAENI|nr:hypothetical protein [Paenarthrobacter nicotinovorans]